MELPLTTMEGIIIKQQLVKYKRKRKYRYVTIDRKKTNTFGVLIDSLFRITVIIQDGQLFTNHTMESIFYVKRTFNNDIVFYFVEVQLIKVIKDLVKY